MSELRRLTPERTSPPTVEPLSLSEVKLHLNIASTDTTHDSELNALIQQAREEWEADTNIVCITSTWRMRHEAVNDSIMIPKRPVQSITSIQYYNTANQLTTCGTDIYNFDTSKQEIRRAYLKVWPISIYRWDAWTTTFVAGYGDDARSVPPLDKRAMLLLIGYYFEQRGDNDRPSDKQAYEKLVMNKLRSSYP